MKKEKPAGAIAVCIGLLLALPCIAQGAESPPADLSLEELLKVEVQTASRKSQRLQDVASAVFVISREDIERSGATSLPEVLRLAPGVQVARLANNRWAVSARGFNGRFANKLLVLMDGRSIYSPLFSGVLWEMEDTLLDDVDRIEVIRGPGAALWGANAVNGVINIITRNARDTRGTLAVAGAGSEERSFGALRHGFAAGEGSVRLWAKGFSRDESVDLSGNRGNDDWHAARAGFRGDWNANAGSRLTVSGSIYNSPTGDRWNVPSVTSPSGAIATDIEQGGSGANLLLKHEWLPADGSASTLQAYVDRTEIDVIGVLGERRTTVDLDFQHRLAPGGAHDVIWGLSHRQSRDQIRSGPLISILPDHQTYQLTSAFVHDEITLQPERLKLALGARLEHNNYTGLEPQPNARLIWTPTAHQALWGALSRAVQNPVKGGDRRHAGSGGDPGRADVAAGVVAQRGGLRPGAHVGTPDRARSGIPASLRHPVVHRSGLVPQPLYAPARRTTRWPASGHAAVPLRGSGGQCGQRRDRRDERTRTGGGLAPIVLAAPAGRLQPAPGESSRRAPETRFR